MIQLHPGDTVCHPHLGIGVVEEYDPIAARVQVAFVKHGVKLVSRAKPYLF